MLEILNELIQDGVDRGVLQNFTQSESINSSTIQIHNEHLVNFGSCSYMGLEFHPNLKAGVIEALDRFGTQFSTSRTYLSIGLYKELEVELETMFEKPVIASASTTLGHLAALPILVEDNDAVIIDLQVHSSVQMTAQLLKARKIPTFIIPHNDMDQLEHKIRALNNKHKRIWYLADGVYSMYGDTAPLEKLEELLNIYPKFHLYVDDAHGMGWTGKHGTGFVRSQMEHHDKLFLATSLNKSFASSGGVLIFPNETWKRKVLNCGTTLIFSGPIQPPMLGAAIASAKLHQTNEFKESQRELQAKIAFTNRRLAELDLPQYQVSNTPLFFIPAGLPTVCLCIIKRMKNRGFYLNAAGFPAVPMKKGGIRFMINNQLSFEEIDSMLTALQEEYILGLQEHNTTPKYIADQFGIPYFLQNHAIPLNKGTGSAAIEMDIVQSITTFNKEKWNDLFSGPGTNTWETLHAFESIFSGKKQEDNWKINYIRIVDKHGELVLLAPYTVALMMDDLLADKDLSRKIKVLRIDNPYYLTSNVVFTGTPFTKGKSIHINYGNQHWTEALKQATKYLQELAEKNNASKLIVREFNVAESSKLKNALQSQGMLQVPLPSNMRMDDLTWNDATELGQRMNQKYRYSLRKEILAFEHLFEVKPLEYSPGNAKIIYELYGEVYDRSGEISVFKLPFELFEHFLKNESFDVIGLYSRDSLETPEAVMISQIANDAYYALIVGLNYDVVQSKNTYKQILYRTLLRAKSLNLTLVDLAYTAEIEKKKVGAVSQETHAYIMSFDHMSHAIMETLR